MIWQENDIFCREIYNFGSLTGPRASPWGSLMR